MRATVGGGGRDQVAERAALLTVHRVPIQSVLPAGVAAKRRGIQPWPSSVVRRARVDALRGNVGAAQANHRQLVLADPSCEDFLDSGRGIESPRVPVLYQRN